MDGNFVFGNPTFRERRSLWPRLGSLHYDHIFPWFYTGDFNEILHQDEKDGVRPHNQSQINLFREFLHDSCLMDLAFKGCKFTWTTNPRDGIVTKKRIDRALANWEWRLSQCVHRAP